MFSLRIFTINYYLSKPEQHLDHTYSDFRSLEVKQVPVIRVFGTTPEGQKSCLHVHNVFPYLLVRPFRIIKDDELKRYMYELSSQIDKTLNYSLCIRDANTQHVFKIDPINTKSMYGYHEKESLFLKVFIYNPDLIRKLSDLLVSGTIMGESLQTYEAHIPYNLQFLMDHNLFGMNFIHLTSVKFRRLPLINQDDDTEKMVGGKSQLVQLFQSDSNIKKKWIIEEMNDDMLLEQSIERQSTCDLELDCLAADIANVNMDKDGYMLNPGMSALWQEEKNRRDIMNITKPLETPDLDERTNILTLYNEVEYRQKLISLLEARFEAKYPFERLKNDENDQTHRLKLVQEIDKGDEINDESIIDILNQLHDETNELEDESNDLDNSLLHATQLNDDDKEMLLDDNNDMTQKIASDKLNTSVEKENEEFLHASSDESNDSSDDEVSKSKKSLTEDEITIRVEKEKLKQEELNLSRFSSSSASSSSADSSINEDSSEQVKVIEVDLSHKCTYFEDGLDKTENLKCKHQIDNDSTKSRLGQQICLKCEFGKELADSLDHMAFLSPTLNQKSIRDITQDLKFNSPTNMQENEQENCESDLVDDEIINETITHEDEETMEVNEDADKTKVNDDDNNYEDIELEKSYTQPRSSKYKFNDSQIYYRHKNYKSKRRSSQNSKSSQSPESSLLSQSISISDSTIILSDNSDSGESESSFYKEYMSSRENRHQMRRIKALESFECKDALDESSSSSSSSMSSSTSNLEVPLGPDEAWFCPQIDPPSPSELVGDMFKVNNDPIVKYYKENGKFKMKLNLTEFKNDLSFEVKSLEGIFDKVNDEKAGEVAWFTPVIQPPSMRRIQCKINAKEKIMRNRKNLKMKKLGKIVSSQSLSQSQKSTQSLQTIASSIPCSIDKSDDIDKTIIAEEDEKTTKKFSKSSLGFDKTMNYSKTKAKTRKTVRFADKIQFLNENLENETDLAIEKGHLSVETVSINDKIENVSFKVNKIKSPKSILRQKSQSSSSSYTAEDNINSLESNSNDTVIFENDETLNETCLDTSKPSFYEYESILFPKTSKFIDCLSSYAGANDMSTIIERDEDTTLSSEPKRIERKDKKIISDSKLPVNQSCHLTLMSMELHVNTRGNMTPNPDIDSIGFICFTVYEQNPSSGCLFDEKTFESHLLVYDPDRRSLSTRRFIDVNSVSHYRLQSIEYVYKEAELFELFAKAVKKYDPGFEIQKLSWCFLVRRAFKLELNEFISQISRIPKGKRENCIRIGQVKQKPGSKQQPNLEIMPIPLELVIAGRVVFNLWRILRHELSLNIYSFENCCYHILNERVPKYSYSSLTSWYIHLTDLHRWKTIDYYLYRSQTNLKLLSSLNTIGKASEFARVYGIEFYHVLSRGSQYRVESMMLRIARKLNYVALAASQKQKVLMRAPECIPLTLEPESKFYTDPVAVLDFQSLYPSVIIAYNLCFTTCLGRVESVGKEGCFKFGCSSLFIPDNVLKSLNFEKDVFIAPNSVAFVKPHIRQGVLPIMLEDILKTRVMVKNSMKLYNDENLYKIFDSRQLSLKLIANVTFGYTAANFSGRMPCVEIGDTIVRVARQILENSIKYCNSKRKIYGSRVVYGDTDSLFVLFEKMSKREAFESSYKLVEEITNMYSKPIKLKFEKIYLPCILLAKKRYLGYMFETLEQAEPELDVKGIEIIRRDGCQISAKTLERCCKILFEFYDIEKVKDYLIRQCIKLINGKINLKDFIIAKEYRGRDTYDNVKSIAACQIANKNLAKGDPLAEPLTGERVPYIVIYGMPGLPLYELVRSPNEIFENSELKLNYEYYVMKQIIPPLDRIMSLLNINVYDWMKKLSFKPKMFQYLIDRNEITSKTATISNFIFSNDCVLCGKKQQPQQDTASSLLRKKSNLCLQCSQLDQQQLARLKMRFQKCERYFRNLIKICQLCTNNNGNMMSSNSMGYDCRSLDCPNNFLCVSARQNLKKTDYIRKVIDEFF